MVKESKRVVNFKTLHAEPSEEIVATAEGYIGSTRAVSYRKGWLSEILETMPLKGVTSIERESLLGHRVIRFHTSHDYPKFKFFDKDVEAALAKAVDAGWQAAVAPRDIATRPEAFNPVARLKPACRTERGRAGDRRRIRSQARRVRRPAATKGTTRHDLSLTGERCRARLLDLCWGRTCRLSTLI